MFLLTEELIYHKVLELKVISSKSLFCLTNNQKKYKAFFDLQFCIEKRKKSNTH